MSVEEIFTKIKAHQREMSCSTAKSIKKILLIADKNQNGYINRNDFLQLVFTSFLIIVIFHVLKILLKVCRY